MEIINLKQKRKAKARVEKEKNASANRLKFGRTKAEKQLDKLETDRSVRYLDGHKIEPREE